MAVLTLPVPNWAAELGAPGWANIHDIIPAPPRLSGVDAFLGAPNAHTLVLGKDAAPARVLRQLVTDGHPDPYRHDPALPTNQMLQQVLGTVGLDAPLDGSKAATCGVYYANAYWLLRDDDRFSGPLKNVDAAFEQSRRVLDYMRSSLTWLEQVITMDADGIRCTHAVLWAYRELADQSAWTTSG